MPPDLAYSFDDEVASKFCYDLDGKRLEIHFNGCWEIATRRYHDGPCHLLIHQWTDARCQEEVVSPRFARLEERMGIVSLLLHFAWTAEGAEALVNTIDNRYLLLRFANPSVEVVL
ncbi:hypothetical protein [Hymenobacter canadensis]|jgi:hypothetical protein|uniref:Uncharacterized protein n=1 Tax=Hymenobacter canadensis TaxID=2999067 RepID=A0ABY7LVA3_9BACT|nr:hypothetical protein [Hymenobacter canadensis]WBA43976.1 hypothetical protein O3303_20640 [Hymenobacter canadensis]